MGLTTMRREDAVEFVHGLEQAVNAHDTALLMSMYADCAVLVSPVFGEITGLEEIRKAWEWTFSLFPDWQATVGDVLVDGDRIGFLGTAGATDRNGWFGEQPTGERIDYRAVVLLTIAGSKILRDERIYDLTGVLKILEKARLDKELKLAAEVQRALLPSISRATPFCEAAADSIPCRAIGGDFFELAHLPSGDFVLGLGDVAGKGPAAALLASMIQGMLAVEARSGSTPAAVLEHLNALLAMRGLEPKFASLVYGVLSEDGRFAYSNGGHNPPLLWTREGLRRLSTGGALVGIFADSTFEEETLLLDGGDTLVIFSDGVTEARNAAGEEFGEDRLIAGTERYRGDSVDHALAMILRQVQDFCQGTSQADDITAMVIRFARR